MPSLECASQSEKRWPGYETVCVFMHHLLLFSSVSWIIIQRHKEILFSCVMFLLFIAPSPPPALLNLSVSLSLCLSLLHGHLNAVNVMGSDVSPCLDRGKPKEKGPLSEARAWIWVGVGRNAWHRLSVWGSLECPPLSPRKTDSQCSIYCIKRS